MRFHEGARNLVTPHRCGGQAPFAPDPRGSAGGLRIVARGDALLDPAVTRAVIEVFSRRPKQAERSRAETRGVDGARAGGVPAAGARPLSNAEIAAKLVVGDGTIKTHVARVLQKLDLRDRVQAAIYAYESGLAEAGAAETDY